MLVTENEAKGMWCPACRIHGGNNLTPATDIKPGAFVPMGSCVSSLCMWWRWFDTLNDDGTACHLKSTAMLPRVPQGDQKDESPLTMRRGYCGMAGTP